MIPRSVGCVCVCVCVCIHGSMAGFSVPLLSRVETQLGRVSSPFIITQTETPVATSCSVLSYTVLHPEATHTAINMQGH